MWMQKGGRTKNVAEYLVNDYIKNGWHSLKAEEIKEIKKIKEIKEIKEMKGGRNG